MSGKDIVYWDSCIFIAHLKNEIREDPNDLLGIKQLVKFIDQGKIGLATSTITFTEVLSTSISEENYKLFRSLFSRRDYHLIDVTREIAEISHDIRSHYNENGNGLKTPDAIHLATAIFFNCKEFYTFDGCADPNGLLNLQTPIAGIYDLDVKRPSPETPPQLSFGI